MRWMLGAAAWSRRVYYSKQKTVTEAMSKETYLDAKETQLTLNKAKTAKD
jgi:hypothetical protein